MLLRVSSCLFSAFSKIYFLGFLRVACLPGPEGPGLEGGANL